MPFPSALTRSCKHLDSNISGITLLSYAFTHTHSHPYSNSNVYIENLVLFYFILFRKAKMLSSENYLVMCESPS